VWSVEAFNGQRMIRLRTVHRIILDLTEVEFAESTEVTQAARVRQSLA
jgi:hypothetical protein